MAILCCRAALERTSVREKMRAELEGFGRPGAGWRWDGMENGSAAAAAAAAAAVSGYKEGEGLKAISCFVLCCF